MFKISNHICNELKDSKIIIRKLQLSQRREILDSVFKKYINISERGVCLWEKFIQYEALSDGMAWSYIRYFVKDNECIMFFNQTEEEEMILIQSGEDLNYILSETYGFEFYITDKQCSYLLCFSDHAILYGYGTAKEWIERIKKKDILNSNGIFY